MPSLRRLLQSIAAIFQSPFDGLGLVVVLYFAWAHLVYPHNDVLRGNLPDPDDYMYLTQTLDWLKGQSWFDPIQHRMNPPQGVMLHFSRFTQMPIAVGILFFEKFGLPAQGAAMVTALIEPLLFLGLCLGVLRRTASRVVSESWAGASAYVALFSIALLYEFMPGQVGHHGPVIILILFALGLILRLFEEPENLKLGATAGFTLAFALMIALESLPWVLLLSAYLGFWTLKRGYPATRSGAAFGLTILTGSCLYLLVTRPWPRIFAPDLMIYSIVYVYLAAAVAVPFVGLALLPRAAGAKARWALGTALAALGVFCFLHRFPELAAGPYGAIDARLGPILLDVMEDAKPILKTDHGWAHFFNLMGMGGTALAAAVTFFARAKGTQKEKWGLIALLQASSIGLTLFYQYRFLGIEQAFAIIPLTALLQRSWAWIGAHRQGRAKVLAEIGLLLVLGPLPAVLIPALFDFRSFNAGVLLFPVEPGNTRCDMAQLEKILRNPVELGGRPHTILAQMELGPELLFRTPHSVLGGPYHLNVAGNLDSVSFLRTQNPDEAHAIALLRNVDLIVLCRAMPDFYLRPAGEKAAFVETLFKAPPPDWLEPFPSATLDNFVVFRVRSPRPRGDASVQQKIK